MNERVNPATSSRPRVLTAGSTHEHAKVYLDGKLQAGVVAANPTDGWVIRIKQPPEWNYETGRWRTERVRGSVEVYEPT